MGKDTMTASSIPSHAQTAKFDKKKYIYIKMCMFIVLP